MDKLERTTRTLDAMEELKGEFLKRFPNASLEFACLFGERNNAYRSSERHYHDTLHIHKVWKETEKELIARGDSGFLPNFLFAAICYHDAVYDSRKKDNEAKSADMLAKMMQGHMTPLEITLAVKFIEATASHTEDKWNPADPDEGRAKENYLLPFLVADFSGFKGTFEEVLESEKGIWKEYGWVPWKDYKVGKIAFLDILISSAFFKEHLTDEHRENIQLLKHRMVTFQPNVAVFAGSFNPFTVGHMDILRKAEEIFDKVVIAKASNAKKAGRTQYPMPDCLRMNYQIDMIGGSFPEYLQSVVRNQDIDMTVIRSLRNTTDYEYEKTYIKFLEEIRPGTKVAVIMGDPSLSHVSSSAVCELIASGMNAEANRYCLEPIVEETRSL